MWSHVAVRFLPTPLSARLRAGFPALALVGALTVFAIPGAAGAAAPAASSSELSLAFPSESAHLVGTQALVLVKCLGSQTSSCNGTLTLTTKGHKHKVPFSVIGGTSENVTVPLRSDASNAKRALVVARTAQASGRYVRSSEVLDVR